MTLAAYIDSAGIHAPSYASILSQLQAAFQSIYGNDVYLGNDSQDGQLLAIFAQAISDANDAAIAVYNAFSPAYAQGVGLSSVVKINNLIRQPSTNSTVDITIVGTVGTVINNGIVQDTNNNKWDLPAVVTIPTGGSIVVTATSEVAGAITAAAGTVTKIVTPVLGWLTASNASAAAVGVDAETDAALRVRQDSSTALNATTIANAISSQVANVAGVTAWKLYENDTGAADANGIPANSVCLVVDGGNSVDIATAIALKKGIGTGTYGTTSEVITDTAVGTSVTIYFYRPTQTVITVAITIKALSGFVTTTEPYIEQAIANYINAVGIGGGKASAVEWGAIFKVAAVSGYEDTYSIQAVTLQKDAGAAAAADAAIAFNEIPYCDYTTNVNITVV